MKVVKAVLVLIWIYLRDCYDPPLPLGTKRTVRPPLGSSGRPEWEEKEARINAFQNQTKALNHEFRQLLIKMGFLKLADWLLKKIRKE